MRKELEHYFQTHPIGSTEVVLFENNATGKFIVGALYKCSKADWRYMIQMGPDVPVGQMVNPGTGIRVAVKLFFTSLRACILNLGRG